MRLRPRFLALAFGTLLLAVGGCSTTSGGTSDAPLRFYAGDPLLAGQAAVLRSKVYSGFDGTNIRLNSINGIPGPNRLGWGNGWNGAFHIEIKPGAYTLKVGYAKMVSTGLSTTYCNSTEDLTVEFTAVAGHEYELDADAMSLCMAPRGFWKPTLKDATTGETIL